jgi:hypothetical protein
MFVLFRDGKHTWSSTPPEWSHHRPCSFLMISTPGLVKLHFVRNRILKAILPTDGGPNTITK